MGITADITHGVGRVSVDANFKMKVDAVKPVAVAGITDTSDRLTLADRAADSDTHGTQVGIKSRHAVSMVNNDAVSVCAGILRHDDRTAVSGNNGRTHALVTVDIHTGVEGARAGTVPVRAGDNRVPRERPYIGTGSTTARGRNQLLLFLWDRDFFIIVCS